MTLLKTQRRAWNEWRPANQWVIPNFSELEFNDARLQQALLQNASFFRAGLPGARFDKADHIAANLTNGAFYEAKFTGAKLMNVDPRLAQLVDADFAGCRLSGARFDHADLRGAYLCDAEIHSATFVDVWVDDGTAFSAQ